VNLLSSRIRLLFYPHALLFTVTCNLNAAVIIGGMTDQRKVDYPRFFMTMLVIYLVTLILLIAYLATLVGLGGEGFGVDWLFIGPLIFVPAISLLLLCIEKLLGPAPRFSDGCIILILIDIVLVLVTVIDYEIAEPFFLPLIFIWLAMHLFSFFRARARTQLA